ncbi:hypothetical protein S40285_10924 [Stachybotrys chlorohalonatus IBT 40285]|uniref:Uncharacterized protein n=1 Tax=Stachybotrys chlorohalonatus (strain IBT 40285) TaxID=1283841 RepID=A0A084QGI8_STAC4|nr:hypothetical protein S40285_10924 [Stachybotrys chlorohalonata IBT 40285]
MPRYVLRKPDSRIEEPCSAPDEFTHVTEQNYPVPDDVPATWQEETARDPPSLESDALEAIIPATGGLTTEGSIPSRPKSDLDRG